MTMYRLLDLSIVTNSLRSYKARSILTLLGLVLGTFAVGTVSNISKAMLAKTQQEAESLGKNLVIVRSGRVRQFARVSRFYGEAQNLKVHEITRLPSVIPGVESAVPFIEQEMPVRYLDIKVPSVLVATTEDFPRVRSFFPASGRFFTAEELRERAKVCVLGDGIAKKLFDTSDPVGKRVFFFRASVKVLGVMEPKGVDVSGADQDERVFVPLSTHMRRFSNRDYVTGAYLEVDTAQRMKAVKWTVQELFRRWHRIVPPEEDDVSVLTANDFIQFQTEAVELVTSLGLLTAVIAFSVGGLGIFSIMILMVNQRQLELGIRRAVGAKKRDLIGQILSESTLLAGVGGAVGVVLTVLFSWVVYRVGNFPTVFSVAGHVFAFTGTLVLGALAGGYPAYRAANVEPLQVLRNE
jgi:putative ABC transport system permease protein